jgi:hypothetical protein
MDTGALDAERRRLADHLVRLSARAWVGEVDRLACYESISLDEALMLLGRRFSGPYLESRRQIIWPMLEYFHICFEPEAWAHPLRLPRTARGRRRHAAA